MSEDLNIRFSFFFKSTLSFLKNSAEYLNKILEYEYPSESPKDLAKFLQDILNSIEIRLDNIERNSKRIEDLEILIDELKLIHQALVFLSLNFSIFENSKSELIKREIIFIVEEIKDFFNLENIKVIVSVNYQYGNERK